MTEAGDRAFFEREYDRLSGDLMRYYESIIATERFAIAGAAAVAAFLYTDLPSFSAGQAPILSGLPAAILSLAALRCLSIYLVMRSVSEYLRRIERQLIESDGFGFQNVFARGSVGKQRLIEVTSGFFWVLSVGVAVFFWQAYAPVAAD